MNKSFRLMPEQASSIAADVDRLFLFLLAMSVVLTLAIAGVIVWFAIKYRRHARVNRQLAKSNHILLELSWILGPLALTMCLFFWSAKLYFKQVTSPANAMEINCVARQWMWKFQHSDGRAEINDLHVPLDQPVRINMISGDVIHSLYVPAFRVKQDVLPGRYTSLWFQPSQVGQYHLFCAEYCGAKHSGMQGVVHVLEPAKYQEWLRTRSADESQPSPGKQLFHQLRCGTCHGTGQDSLGPSLENIYGQSVPLQGGRTVVADRTYLRESILRPAAKIVAGYEALMPSFEEQVSEEGILQLIDEIKSMSQMTGTDGSSGPSLKKRIGPEQAPQAPIDEDPVAPETPKKSKTP